VGRAGDFGKGNMYNLALKPFEGTETSFKNNIQINVNRHLM